MKKFFTILFLGFLVQLNAQNIETKAPLIKLSPKLTSTMSKFSVVATAGTPSYSYDALNTAKIGDLKSPNFSNLMISYKVNNRLSYGISSMNGLNNAASGFLDQENQFHSFCEEDDVDDDDHDDDDDDLDDDMDDDDDDDDHEDDDDECEDDDFGQSVFGGATYKFSEKYPFFIQGAAGYSFQDGAPAYTAMIGYNQKVFAGFGIMAGIRYSDVIHQMPVNALELLSPASLKVELGASWNF